MPVSTLIVEGGGDDPIDAAILHALLAGQPAVVSGGSKGSLKPKANDARGPGQRVQARYLRDRDFDHDPPLDRNVPTIDAYVTGSSVHVLGWRWCRHEIESYLVDPRIMAAATGLPEASFIEGIFRAAAKIQSYTAARWAVGTARRRVPPSNRLRTRPEELQSEFALPAYVAQPEDCLDWACKHVQRFLAEVASAVSEAEVRETFRARQDQLVVAPSHLREAGPLTTEDVLLLHSGKDLMAALDPLIYRGFAGDPKTLRRKLRDWVRNNPEEAVAMFPEWNALREALRA